MFAHIADVNSLKEHYMQNCVDPLNSSDMVLNWVVPQFCMRHLELNCLSKTNTCNICLQVNIVNKNSSCMV